MKLSTMMLAAALATTAPLAALAQTSQQPNMPAQTNQQRANLASAPGNANDSHHAMSRRKVEELQAALQGNGAKDLAIDGIWGAKTTEALRDYQKQHGLPATGKLDQPTAEKLTLPHWST
jgi:peptidoglycan hydrolase-like protein with peptidoglycan-binding domain